MLTFLHFVDDENYNEATCSSKRTYKLKLLWDHLNIKLRCIYLPQCDVSIAESMTWMVYRSSEHARSGIKPFAWCQSMCHWCCSNVSGCVIVLEQGTEENIWTKEGWSDGSVEKAA
jgi:hypothetical protein